MSFILFILWIFIQIVIGLNLFTPFLIVLIAAGSKKKATEFFPSRTGETDFAVIVTAYSQTAFLNAAVNSLLRMNYSNYLVYVVADNCDVSHLNFPIDKVLLLQPPVVLQNNVASHFYAIHSFRRPHTYLTIIDSDNLVHPDYLTEMDRAVKEGNNAIQGTRKPKNLDTMVARLDAARDIYYTYYDCEKLFSAGSSATLAGSGMSFRTKLYCLCMGKGEIPGAGFDKVLQYEIVRRGEVISFCKNAVVFDEKTVSRNQLIGQRARWIGTWFKYFGFGSRLVKSGVAERNKNKFLFGVILLRPPLFLFLLTSVLFLLINVWLYPVVAVAWAMGIGAFCVAFFLALKNSKTDKRIYRSLKNIPLFIFYQVLALLRLKKNHKYPVATEHIYSTSKLTGNHQN